MYDVEKDTVEQHVQSIMMLLDIKVTDSNRETPRRISKMLFDELFATRNDLGIDELKDKMKLFSNEGTTSPIEVSDIPFNSVCEHHWLPFFGTASVTYIPNESIVGLSKIPRVVKYFSKRPQLQERLTNDIGNYLFDLLQPKYLKVEMTASHTCVMCRGAEIPCTTKTLFERGVK